MPQGLTKLLYKLDENTPLLLGSNFYGKQSNLDKMSTFALLIYKIFIVVI